MSLHVGKAKLVGSMKDLLVKWEETKQSWDDPVSRAMEKLKSGELDTEAVYRDAASRLLATDFRTA